MNKWIAEFDLEDGDTMPEHMDLEYKGARIDFHCRPLEQEPTTKNNLGVDCISRTRAIERLKLNFPISQGADNSRDRHRYMQALADLQAIKELPSITPQEPTIKALGEELRKARKGIAEEKVLIGYNMAIAICNKHLEGSEAADDQSGAG